MRALSANFFNRNLINPNTHSLAATWLAATAGCVLVVEPKNTSDQTKIGKVIAQNPGADAVVPRGSNVTVDIGVQVLGETLTSGQEAVAAPNLARTGGLFLGGLSLWLLVDGLAARDAGSKRLWRLARRDNG